MVLRPGMNAPWVDLSSENLVLLLVKASPHIPGLLHSLFGNSGKLSDKGLFFLVDDELDQGSTAFFHLARGQLLALEFTLSDETALSAGTAQLRHQSPV
ncbi:hypothetical protein EGR_10705 [Echinococcus granulosus]|uniref:Uncharacterized protein n=1 Tax=Echinococcus granulosus TaxID=6210 RepID=W6U7V1_ECHGR|nr:hypothetical protein EGR_10705 [Echinococcus granulosus]EUB54442.1 hypothetical protein EGR_10705 [Echinococcus granulosus]